MNSDKEIVTKSYIRKSILNCLENICVIIEEDNYDDINLTDFNIDSISFMTFIVDLENSIDINIPDEFLTFEILRSLNGMINLIFELKVSSLGANEDNNLTVEGGE